MKRIITGIMAMLLCVGLLTGCGPDFDPAAYTQGCLDALLKENFSEQYLNFSGNSEEMAKSSYKNSIEKDLDLFLSDEETTSDALREKYRQMFTTLYKKTKYEIGNVVAGKDNTYKVTVKAYRMIVFADTIQPVYDYFDSLSAKEQDKIIENNNEKLDMMVVDNAIKNLEDPKYEDKPTEIEITVAPVKGNSAVYAISTEDYQKIYAALMDGDEWTKTAEEQTDDEIVVE